MTQASIQKTMTASDWALLAILSIVWGGSFLFVGVAVRELPPLTIVALRVVTAASALLLTLRLMGVDLPRTRQVWSAFLGMSILNNVIPFTLIVWGQSHIASGLASILNATTPLFTVIVAHYLTEDERLTGQRFAGVIVGFAGVAVMIGAAAFASLDASILAQLAVLGAALSYGFSGVFGRRFKTMGIPPLATAAGQVTVSSAILLPTALIVDRPWTLAMPSTGAIVSLAALGLVSTAFAYLIFFRLLARAGATNVGLVTFLIPVSAILLGVLVLGETLAMRHMAGMALIGGGLILIDGRLLSALKARFSVKEPAPHGNG
ncbi:MULTISPECIES: DMT family transporter [Microvirga]|jgi:drug/metabolite transporter (DMT)-like permease|uniref:EamA family transporter n=1 Tax=Microvirga tunisiensis TaxID=2108360 RepID=A0A5N7MDG1_9HYPH|nr:EamA family transporter [Microvirga tunisiensis]MPR06584.1 EamA family transporter [Microvirga tunisiensis]MPR24698.1 EamA family transporter [Microvirga tunisiensis]